MRLEQLLISCEHAANRIPRRYAGLGLASPLLTSHIARDLGARDIARSLARYFSCSYYEGMYSRLLVDLNRSLPHGKLIPTRSFGITIPGNMGISRDEREARVRRYYTPFRAAVVEGISRIISHHGTCLHLSVHSFTPEVGGQERRADIGLLYDPHRNGEWAFVHQLAEELKQHDLRVRLNYPYRGTSDGFTTHGRRLFLPEQYIGLEIEVNQRHLEERRKVYRMAHWVAQSLHRVLERLGETELCSLPSHWMAHGRNGLAAGETGIGDRGSVGKAQKTAR